MQLMLSQDAFWADPKLLPVPFSSTTIRRAKYVGFGF
jgi:hypothetical protein